MQKKKTARGGQDINQSNKLLLKNNPQEELNKAEAEVRS